ncbi:MAG: 4'-phosphopantetheinyl transferase superfamily protein [Acidobacteriota bacterium]
MSTEPSPGSSTWPARATDRALPFPERHEIHVWRVALDPSPQRVERLGDLLTDEEHRRAARFHFPRHRRRFIVRRSALRSILGAYLERDPSTLTFTVGKRGKPRLEGEDLQFNLSDSADLALVAVGIRRSSDPVDDELGVDVEKLRTSHDLDGLAHRFFSSAEVAALDALPTERHVDGFFRAWTRKEAYLKAIGTGLHTPLGSFSVSLEPDAPPRFLDIDGSPTEAAAWSLHHLDVDTEHIGALAVRRSGDTIHTFDWQPAG